MNASACSRDRNVFIASCALGVLLFANTARAEGEEQHDGMMLRFSLGLGPVRLSDEPARSDGAAPDATADLGSSLAIDLGAAIARDLVLHARWSSLLGERPSGKVQLSLLGPGLTYYWMDLNLYVTAVAGVALDVSRNAGGVQQDGDPFQRPARIETEEEIAATAGAGFDLEIGKEFWVSENWGIGPVLRVSVWRLDYEGPGALWVTAWTVAFSATYQ